MLTPVEYSFATPKDLGNLSRYQRFADKVGLDRSHKSGYGFLHCRNEDGERWTAVTPDVEYLRLIVEGNAHGAIADLEIPADKFMQQRPGWPDDWA